MLDMMTTDDFGVLERSDEICIVSEVKLTTSTLLDVMTADGVGVLETSDDV